MTAPRIVDLAGLLGEALSDASPDLIGRGRLAIPGGGGRVGAFASLVRDGDLGADRKVHRPWVRYLSQLRALDAEKEIMGARWL